MKTKNNIKNEENNKIRNNGKTRKGCGEPGKGLVKRTLRAGIFAALFAGTSFSAFAMPPYDNIPEGLTEEEWNRMQDNLIEYDELGNLIQYYNPAYTQAMDSAGSSVEGLSYALDQFSVYYMDQDLNSGIKSMKDTLRNIEETIGAESDEYNGLKAQLALAEASDKQLRSTIRSTTQSLKNTKKSVEISLRPVKDNMEFAMQSIFVQYNQLLINREMAAKQAELYRTILDMNENTGRQGMATEQEILSAKSNLESAELQLEQIDNTIESLRRSMGLQLGWGAESLPEIGELPEPDVGFVDTANPDADKTAAFMHNSELKDVERYSGGSALRDVTDRKTNEYRGKLTAKMDSFYADMKNKKVLYEAAETGKEKAELEKASADRKYALGLLGNTEYESLQLSYISAEASYELAKLNLFNSINTYKWAVDGVVTIE